MAEFYNNNIQKVNHVLTKFWEKIQEQHEQFVSKREQVLLALEIMYEKCQKVIENNEKMRKHYEGNVARKGFTTYKERKEAKENMKSKQKN